MNRITTGILAAALAALVLTVSAAAGSTQPKHVSRSLACATCASIGAPKILSSKGKGKKDDDGDGLIHGDGPSIDDVGPHVNGEPGDVIPGDTEGTGLYCDDNPCEGVVPPAGDQEPGDDTPVVVVSPPTIWRPLVETETVPYNAPDDDSAPQTVAQSVQVTAQTSPGVLLQPTSDPVATPVATPAPAAPATPQSGSPATCDAATKNMQLHVVVDVYTVTYTVSMSNDTCGDQLMSCNVDAEGNSKSPMNQDYMEASMQFSNVPLGNLDVDCVTKQGEDAHLSVPLPSVMDTTVGG